MCWLSCRWACVVAGGTLDCVDRGMRIVEVNQPMIQSIADGGIGSDGVWSDDFHHISRVGSDRARASVIFGLRGIREGVPLRSKIGVSCSRASGTHGRRNHAAPPH